MPEAEPAKDDTPVVQITPASPAVGEAGSEAVFNTGGRHSVVLQPVSVQLEDHHGDALRRMDQGDHHDAEFVFSTLLYCSYSSCCAVTKPFSPAH